MIELARTIGAGASSIHVRERGRGPTIVFGHSLGFDGEMWDAQTSALARCYRTIAIDFRGHGRTHSAGAFTLDDLADDVAAVLDVLGVDRAVYCGLSLGGMVGMRLALRHPARVAALALCNTSAEPEERSRRRMFEAYNEHARGRAPDVEGAALMMSLMFSREFLIARPEVTARFRDKLLQPVRGDGRYHAAAAVLAREGILDRIGVIDVPVLVIGSTGDTAVPIAHARAIASAIAHAHLVELASGHMSAVEQADAFGVALSGLLEALESAQKASALA